MFEFVSKKEVSLARNEIEPIIHKVQNYLRKNNIMTFKYYLVGSASNRRHLVTRIIGVNKGFDMDYNIIIKSINKAYDDAEKTKHIIMETFNKFLLKGFKHCEDSSSVFTIKKIDKQNSKIIYSFDFAIVNYYNEDIQNPDFDYDYDDPEDEYETIERQEYIYFDKQNNKYFWKLRPIAFDDHRYKEQYVKEEGLWSELRDLYLKQKNNQQTKKSRIIYYETLNQLFQKY